MQPSDGFWTGVGDSIGSSPGWMVVGALLVLGVIFLVARYIVPSRERIRMREMDIREREAENDSERIKANAMLAEQQRQTNVLIEGMGKSLDASTAHTDVLVTELRGARDRSKSMGVKVEDTNATAHRIDETTQDTNAMVAEVHSMIVRKNQ